MNRLSENSCLKGCLVYLVVLVVVMVGSAIGLGGLSAGLGVDTQSKQVAQGSQSRQVEGDEQKSEVPVPSVPQKSEADSQITIQISPPEGQVAATPTPKSQQPQVPTPMPQPLAQPQQTPATPSQGGSGNSGFDISGQATLPFYIVQPGDTLFDISLRFGTTVEALRAANSLGPGDNLIYSGNVLYLPGAESPSQPESQVPAPPPVEQEEPPLQPPGSQTTPADQPVPTMPNTGVNSAP